jgi:hypothetical protein
MEHRNNQLLQDNIEMHGIIEALRSELERNINDLTVENKKLEEKISQLITKLD